MNRAPKFAQFTGMVVTAIVVFGTDTDVLMAVPLGLLAGALAIFFVSLSEGDAARVKVPVKSGR